MKKYQNINSLLLVSALFFGCADNTFDELPLDNNFAFQLVLDVEEGADLPDAEDFGLEVKFADYLPDLDLPGSTIILSYEIFDLEDDMVGNVVIDKVIYEIELDDCVYERELTFTSAGDGLNGTITISPDADLGTVPEAFEIVFTLPGLDNTEGSFKMQLSNLQSSANLLLGYPRVFEYNVLDNDVAGEWQLEIKSEEEFEEFKAVFGELNPDLQELSFEDITGSIKAEFGFEEMKFEIELVETETIVTCEDGEEETEIENKVIEFEAEYEAEDGELVLEGSREIINDAGLVEDELDFIVEGEYEIDEVEDTVIFRFFSVIDEDNYREGEELFQRSEGVIFTFKKD